MNNTMKPPDGQSISDELAAAGLANADVAHWRQAEPSATTDFAADGPRYSAFWQLSNRLIARLPPRARRNAREQAAALAILTRARAARTRFLAQHGDAVYDALT